MTRPDLGAYVRSMWGMLADGLKLVFWTAFVLLVGILLGFLATGRSFFRESPTPALDGRAPFVAVAQRVLPAVVSIEVERWIPHPPVDGLEEGLLPDGSIRVPSSGSGFLFDAEGHVLTNDHVVRGAGSIWVHLHDGRQFRAAVVGTDPETDICVLQVSEAPQLESVPLGHSGELEIGDWVAAVGNPLGHLSGSFTVGVVSGTGRNEINILGGAPTYQDFIQTDATIHYGNSGGPLVNQAGEAVGVNTAFGGSGSGIGFAIPIDLARDVARSLIDHGHVVRGYLGVMLQDVDSDLARAFGLDRVGGALVREVYAETPAGTAGVEAGDLILDFGGRPVRDVSGLRLLVARADVGETVPVQLLRFGQEHLVHVTLVERPAFEAHPGLTRPSLIPSDSDLGIWVSAPNDSLGGGVLVDSVVVAGLAHRSGLVRGDLIVEMDGLAIETIVAFDEAVERAGEQERPVVVRVNRGGERWYLALATPRLPTDKNPESP